MGYINRSCVFKALLKSPRVLVLLAFQAVFLSYKLCGVLLKTLFTLLVLLFSFMRTQASSSSQNWQTLNYTNCFYEEMGTDFFVYVLIISLAISNKNGSSQFVTSKPIVHEDIRHNHMTTFWLPSPKGKLYSLPSYPLSLSIWSFEFLGAISYQQLASPHVLVLYSSPILTRGQCPTIHVVLAIKIPTNPTMSFICPYIYGYWYFFKKRDSI